MSYTTEGDPDPARIVLTGQWSSKNDRCKVPIHYALALIHAGAKPVLVAPWPVTEDQEVPDELSDLEMRLGIDPEDVSVLDEAAGLVVPGGGDVDPRLYGQERHSRTKDVSDERDAFEEAFMRAAIERDIPLLAICHGMQILNVLYGGTLEQHLADSPERIEHDRDMPRAEPVHSITVAPESHLYEAMGEEAQVNSHHHQGVDRLGDGLQPVAWAGDGTLEAVEVEGSEWAVGVQWHPETMALVDSKQRKLFDDFIAAARRRAAALTA